MGRSRREDSTGRDVGLIGEKRQAIHSYNNAGGDAVDAMMRGEHPTSFIGTIECASHSNMGRHNNSKDSDRMEKREGHEPHKNKGGKMPKFAAGGVGKIRKGAY